LTVVMQEDAILNDMLCLLVCFCVCLGGAGGHWSGSVFFGLSLSVPSLHNSICWVTAAATQKKKIILGGSGTKLPDKAAIRTGQ
jgi:hypothetical protein